MKSFAALNVQKCDLKYDDVLKVASMLNIKVNKDRLYDEINLTQSKLKKWRLFNKENVYFNI